MRKNQTLLVAGILLLASTAVAQGQAVLEVTPFGAIARARGAGEMTGSLLLARTVGMSPARKSMCCIPPRLRQATLYPQGGQTSQPWRSAPPTSSWSRIP